MTPRANVSKVRRRPASWRVVRHVVLFGALSLLGACGRSSAKADPEPARPAPPAPAAQSGGVQPASLSRDLPAPSDRFSEAAFDLELRLVGTPVSGQTGRGEVQLVAKAPYHVNAEYPIKLTFEPSPGISYPKPVVRKESAKIEQMKASVPVEFVAQSGRRRVAGLLAFSVCTAERCLLEKRPLALAFDVK